MAWTAREHEDDFAGGGVYGHEEPARARVAVLRRGVQILREVFAVDGADSGTARHGRGCPAGSSRWSAAGPFGSGIAARIEVSWRGGRALRRKIGRASCRERV